MAEVCRCCLRRMHAIHSVVVYSAVVCGCSCVRDDSLAFLCVRFEMNAMVTIEYCIGGRFFVLC